MNEIFIKLLMFTITMASSLSGFLFSAYVLESPDEVRSVDTNTGISQDWSTLLLGSVGCLVLSLLLLLYFKNKYEEEKKDNKKINQDFFDMLKQELERERMKNK